MSDTNNPVMKLNDLYKEFVAGGMDRRAFMLRASVLGISAASLSMFFRGVPASAQDATPVASPATFEPFASITRAEYKASLAEAFPFTKDPGAKKTGGKLIMGEIASSNLTTVNPILANNNPTLAVVSGPIFESLVGSSPIDAQYVPGIADSWEIAADGKTYTFHLNPNAKWHDGKPLTADDIVFSFDAQKNPDTGSSYTSSFTATVASYSKIDDHTVEVVAVDVFAQVLFLGNSYCPILAKHIWESVPVANWKTDGGSTGQDPTRVVGSGPFKFKSINEAEGTATLVKNPDYYDDKAQIDEFIFQVWPDESAAIEALRAGDIDFYENVPASDTQSLIDDPNLEVALYDTYSFSWYGYNLDTARTDLFQDVNVRHALLYALDRESLVKNILLGFGEVAQGSQPKLSIAYAPDKITTKYGFDVAKAKQLLADAGWVAGGDGVLAKDGKKFAFEIMYGSGSASSDSIVAAIQDYWKAIGVAAKPNPVDFDTVLIPALTTAFNYDICFLGFSWDATADQSALFGTAAYKAGFNAMRYSNPKVDVLFAEASREIDPDKRKSLLIDVTNLINEDLPVAVTWFRKDRTAYNIRVHNFTPNATAGLLWSLPYTWVE